MYPFIRGVLPILATLPVALSLNGGKSPNPPLTYMSNPLLSLPGGSGSDLKSASYQYTGMGSAESNINFAADGSLIYSPAFTNAGNGYATSQDGGSTWSQVLPHGGAQPRTQPVFRKPGGIPNRFFFWSSSVPGFDFSYSDNNGQTWTNLNNSHFDTSVNDWAKLVAGPPVRSTLTGGAKQIMYFSAPSFISTPLPVQPLGPVNQLIMKSTNGGSSWAPTKGTPTLNPLISGGSCAGLLENLATQELIIWGDGFVAPNGTVMFGLRRCQKLSVAISDDEGDTWRFSDVPRSSLAPFIAGDLTYLFNGNVLVPEPISMDKAGNIYSIWVDQNYVLRMSVSRDFANTWSYPVIIAAPGNSTVNSLMTYLPTLVHHPVQQGRAALAYYGSSDGGATYNAYVAETLNIAANTPAWTSFIVNKPSEPMQHNQDGAWDQGYGNPFGDLLEFTDIKYVNGSTDFVAAFARRMCSAPSNFISYNASSCVDGWNYTAQANSTMQGFVAFGSH